MICHDVLGVDVKNEGHSSRNVGLPEMNERGVQNQRGGTTSREALQGPPGASWGSSGTPWCLMGELDVGLLAPGSAWEAIFTFLQNYGVHFLIHFGALLDHFSGIVASLKSVSLPGTLLEAFWGQVGTTKVLRST